MIFGMTSAPEGGLTAEIGNEKILLVTQILELRVTKICKLMAWAEIDFRLESACRTPLSCVSSFSSHTSCNLNPFPFFSSRRLKRAKMMERNYRCIWKNTPSPPPGELTKEEEEQEQRRAQDRAAVEAAAIEAVAAAKNTNNRIPEGDARPDADAAVAEEQQDEVLQQLSLREVSLFKTWLEDERRRAVEAEEDRLREEEENKIRYLRDC